MRPDRTCPHCQQAWPSSDDCAEHVEPQQVRIDARPAAPKNSPTTLRGMLARALVVGGIGVALALLHAAVNRSDSGKPAKPAEPAEPANAPIIAEAPSMPTAAPTALPAVGNDWEQSLSGIVVIRSNDASGAAHLGAGFVVREDGLIATNYHVMSEATEAQATFQNGASYEIAGYAAVRPDEDLAIVRLRQAPPLRPLPWNARPSLDALAEVVAIGHPAGLDFSPSDGKVSRMVQSSQLPSHSRRFLRQIVSPTVDHLWIQHTAGISPGSSGGPLMTADGNVVGVNTWVDRESQFGYALHIKHLQQLLDAPLNELAPLDRYAKPSARVARLLKQLSAERIRELAAEADAMHWLPESETQYEILQQLAWSVTVSSLPATFSLSDALDARLRELVTATDRVRQRLATRKWDSIGQVTLVNEQAAQVLDTPLAGVAVFAQVIRFVEGDRGSRGMLMRVAGQEQTIFVPLDGQLQHPAVKTNCLVLGVNYDGQMVRYGDNPLRLIESPVIVSEMVLPIDTSTP